MIDKNSVLKHIQKNTMDEKESSKRKPDPKKTEALRSLPTEILENLTKEEVKAFLFDEVWPDSLRDKLKEYLV